MLIIGPETRGAIPTIFALTWRSRVQGSVTEPKWDPLIPPLRRAKNICSFDPFVSGYEPKDAVECFPIELDYGPESSDPKPVLTWEDQLEPLVTKK